MNILTRHRSAVEPEGREGIADFLHRLLPLGTYERERRELESEQRDLGASISTAGDPTIPFGDFYSSRHFSWIRLECLLDKREKAAALLAEMMKTPMLSKEAVEEVRDRMHGFASFNAGSPDRTASRLLAEALYGDTLGRDIYGTRESISSVTVEDLRNFHGKYFSGKNLIITVVSGMPVQQSIELVERLFSDIPPGVEMVAKPLNPTKIPKVVEFSLDKPQGAYAAGAVAGSVDETDALILPVASGWLNARMVEEMREKEGLAYSLGASLTKVDGKAVFAFSMGTAPEKLERAREALREQIRRAREDFVTRESITREVNALTGRLQMRMLSSINRAFYLGLAERNSLSHTFDEDYRQQLLTIRSCDVERVLEDFLPDETLVEILVR
jgi:zinc protease